VPGRPAVRYTATTPAQIGPSRLSGFGGAVGDAAAGLAAAGAFNRQQDRELSLADRLGVSRGVRGTPAYQSVVDFVNRWAPVRQLPPGIDLSAYRNKSSADDFISRIKISGDDDVFSSPISPLGRGWPWKALKKDENANLNNWMPRLMPNESTPLTEMLASAGKQSVLHGLGGGARACSSGSKSTSPAGKMTYPIGTL
jgi:hypothetical protein